jgi:hypothetical protein
MTCFLGLATALAAISTVVAVRLRTQLGLTTSRLEAATADVANVRAQLDASREQLNASRRRHEIVEGQVARLTQLKTSLEKDLGDLRVAYSDMWKRLKRADDSIIMMADPNGVRAPRPLPVLSDVPAIDARVAAVRLNATPELVLLSVGSDDGVEKGFQFNIYRGVDFIGKVVVEKVLKDSSGCRVLYRCGDTQILAGDCAATKLQ